MPSGYDKKTIQIGIPAEKKEKETVRLFEIGDTILPSASWRICERTHMVQLPDKSKPKEERYITTTWMQPYGNDNAAPVACDIYRKCYQRIEMPATEIEMLLFESNTHQQYIIANLSEAIRENYLVDAVNVFLEIFGECYIYSDEFTMDVGITKRRCNWEILPPGVKPSIHLAQQLISQGESADTYDVARLKELDRFLVEQVVEGINGFEGYYAYIFKKHCVLESAIYGNATYIIPKENWEVLSQKTKQELLNENVVIAKLIHTEKWKWELRKTIMALENQ